jgi:hypothetical protein
MCTPPRPDKASDTVLLDALVTFTQEPGIWTIECGVFPRTRPVSHCIIAPASAKSTFGRRLRHMTHGPHTGG